MYKIFVCICRDKIDGCLYYGEKYKLKKNISLNVKIWLTKVGYFWLLS